MSKQAVVSIRGLCLPCVLLIRTQKEMNDLLLCFWQNDCRVEEETWGETAEGAAAEGQTPGGKDAQAAEALGEGE